MNEETIRRRIRLGRSFINKFAGDPEMDEDYASDQTLKKPQPPLAKAPMTDRAADLPTDFSGLSLDNDFLHVINSRCSRRVYTQEAMPLAQLSCLLWCAQGVKSLRGKAYATLRTVPSGGARHPFECYMALRNVEGLSDGLYHYLPMKHQIEFLGCPEDLPTLVSRSLNGQAWAAKANAVFFLSCIFYRAEWRYGIRAHAPILMDSGHVTQNLYLAATALGLGGCAIAALDPAEANRLLGLDGEEETVFYAMAVGTIREEDRGAEDDFYAFVREEGL